MRVGLPLVATLLALVVVVLGAYTRLSDAGLGCPDWPGCYGHIGVPDNQAEVSAANQAFPDRPVEAAKAWKEMIHRYAAGILGLAVLALFLQAWFGKLGDRGLSSGLLVLVSFQAALGMWTVTLLVKPLIVSAHLLGGLATLSLLWLLTLRRSRRVTRITVSPGQKKVAMFMLLVVIAQILLGGWTSTNYAALACVGLPQCNGQWLPTMDFANGFKLWHGLGIDYEGGILDSPARVAIHFSHRLGALITLVVVGSGVIGFLMTATSSGIRGCALWVGAFLLVQLSLGLANVWFFLPLPVAIAHNGVAALLLLAIVTLNYMTTSDRQFDR